MTDKTPSDEPTAAQPTVPEPPAQAATPPAQAAAPPAEAPAPGPDPVAAPGPAPAAETGPAPAAETGPAPTAERPTLVATPAAVPPPPGQPGAWSRMRSRRVPLLVAVATLLAGCVLGAGVVAVGAVIADLGDRGGHHMSRDGGYGPGGRGWYPGDGRNGGGPFGPGGRNRRGVVPAQPGQPGQPATPASPAPSPSASS